MSVSPWPGKCFAHGAMRESKSPDETAAENFATVLGSSESQSRNVLVSASVTIAERTNAYLKSGEQRFEVTFRWVVSPMTGFNGLELISATGL